MNTTKRKALTFGFLAGVVLSSLAVLDAKYAKYYFKDFAPEFVYYFLIVALAFLGIGLLLQKSKLTSVGLLAYAGTQIYRLINPAYSQSSICTVRDIVLIASCLMLCVLYFIKNEEKPHWLGLIPFVAFGILFLIVEFNDHQDELIWGIVLGALFFMGLDFKFPMGIPRKESDYEKGDYYTVPKYLGVIFSVLTVILSGLLLFDYHRGMDYLSQVSTSRAFLYVMLQLLMLMLPVATFAGLIVCIKKRNTVVKRNPYVYILTCALSFLVTLGTAAYTVYTIPEIAAESDSDSSSSGSLHDSYRHTESDAFMAAKDVVSRYLKSPSTASFCRRSEASITVSGNSWFISGWVDAQNSFGATIRNHFRVGVTFTSNTKYMIDYCDIS